jgi:two-component system, cell cycle sensor histidine kinase and response regulator CckA
LMSFYPIGDAEADVTAVGVVIVDTTNVRFLEEQLLQSQKMEAVGQLAGGIAHDFNNLLTVMTVYSALLLEDIADDDPKRGDIEEIRAAAERASVLTRQLLAFSRKQVIQPRHVSLNDVVRGVGRMLPRLIGEDITVETALDDSLALINADPGQLEQVVINLAVNARDAMPNGGRLRISTRNTTLDAEMAERRVGGAAGNYVVLSISDTGTGIPAEVQRHMFEPFYTTKESGRGTGLGLSTVFGIVKQAGGDLTVYSEMEEGTTFNLYFPALSSDARANEAAEGVAQVRGGSETVLLVEDDPHLILLSEKILGRLGYTVLLARNGGEAIETIERHGDEIAIVITDVVMPVLGGRLLGERVRELRADLPVLFMSGYTSDEVTRRGILEGEVPFIQKPFNPDEFGRKVREVLDAVGMA